MGGIDKLTAPVRRRGRCSPGSLDALGVAAGRSSGSSSLDARADAASPAIEAPRRGCRDRSSRSSPGGERRAADGRRGWSPGSAGAAPRSVAAAGRARPTTGSSSSTTAHGRSPRPSSSPRSPPRPRSTAPRSPSCPSPRRSSGSTASVVVGDRRPRRRSPRPRRRRASGGRSCDAAFERFPPAGPDAWTDEAALLEACRIPVHALPGEPTNLKVTVPADLARVEAALAPRRSADVRSADRVGIGVDSHPFGPGRAARPRRHRRSPARHGSTATPTATSRSTPSPTRCSAPPASATSGGSSRPARRRPAAIASGELLAAVVARLAAAGLAPAPVDLTIVGARPRLGRPPRRDARRRSPALLGLDAGRGRASRPRPATSAATRAPAGASRPTARRGRRVASPRR